MRRTAWQWIYRRAHSLQSFYGYKEDTSRKEYVMEAYADYCFFNRVGRVTE